jgi:hypothetical protein
LFYEFFGSVYIIDDVIKPALNRIVADDVMIDSVKFTPADNLHVLHAVKKLGEWLNQRTRLQLRD